MSSLAAARADNFYYPPEWTPKQIWSFTMKSACCKHEIVIQTDPKNCEYVIISGAQRKNAEFDVEDAETFALPADEERGKLADLFYRLEHQEEDLQKKKEAEPVLVQLQRVSDARHSDDCALHKALQAQLRSQKKRVAEEEFASSKMGLGIRLLPTTKEDGCIAAHVKFSSRFEKNRKDKGASINAASIFPESFSNKKHLELEDKRRKISVAAAYNLLSGGLKPSSWL